MRTKQIEQDIHRFQEALSKADAVLIGAGAGLSTSAGFAYDGERFQRYFADVEARYGFHDMYTGGFSHSRRWKSNGHIGAGSSMSTDTVTRLNQYTRICSDQ